MKVVPKDVLGAIQDGQIHTLTKGFGLGGGIGYGKSCAISALLKLGLARWAHASSSGWDFRPTSRRTPVISWVNWPNTADQLQQLATNGNAVHSLMYAIKGANILVIDDLGKERLPVIREDRSIPFCQAQLDIIIDFRNGHRLPTLWTTNVDEKSLVAVYGPATYTRLIQDNPIDWVGARLRNLRLQ